MTAVSNRLPAHGLLPALFLAWVMLIPAAAQAAVYLTRDSGNGSPESHAYSAFHCSDTIYAVIQGNWLEGSTHRIEAYWTDPQGRQREVTRVRFDAIKGITRAWAWLKLHPGERDLLDKLMMEEDTSLQAFVGEWQLAFKLDGKLQRKTRFRVSC